MMCNSISSVLGQIRTEAWEAQARYETEVNRWREKFMSWSVEAAGKNQQAVKAHIVEQLTRFSAAERQREVARCINDLIDLFGIEQANAGNLDLASHIAVHIASSGHINERGWGQISIEIRTMSATTLVDTAGLKAPITSPLVISEKDNIPCDEGVPATGAADLSEEERTG